MHEINMYDLMNSPWKWEWKLYEVSKLRTFLEMNITFVLWR